jgi:hypothetical protein
MTRQEPEAVSHDAVRDGVARALGAIALCGMALIHLLDVPSKFSETPYMGWMYVGLILAAVGIAAVLAATGDVRGWAAAGAVAVTVMLGYTLSRTTGLPQATDDIGNWGEPLGMASLFVEGLLAALSCWVVASPSAWRSVGVRSEARREYARA